MSPKRYAIVFCATAGMLMSLYTWAFVAQMGAPVAAEYWVSRVRTVKEDIAAKTIGPKVIVVAGSSGLFGIDSSEIEAEVHKPVINMALHAGLSLDWLLKYAEANSKAGDVIVMPLENAYFLKDDFLPSAWMSTQVVAWDPNYFKRLDLMREAEFIASTAPSAVAANLMSQINRASVLAQTPYRAPIPTAELLRTFEKQPKPTEIYSYLNINLNGDVRESCGTRPPKSIEYDNYDLSSTSRINPDALLALVSASSRMDAQGKKLFIGFQPVARNPTTIQPWFHAKSAEIAGDLRKAGLRVLGSQSDYYFNQSDFFDTTYHLNCSARGARSKVLGKQLAMALG